MMGKSKLLLCFVFVHLRTFYGELFTALSDLEPLLRTQERVVNDLQHYITEEEGRLEVLKRQLNVYRREHARATEDVASYLGSPINAFTLINRMTTGLDFIKLSIDLGAARARKTAVPRYEDACYPGAKDLRGAARALSRLQRTYLLKADDLAEGILDGVIYRNDITDTNENDMTTGSSKMSASDCYEFGRILFEEGNYQNALPWMMSALHKLTEENFYGLIEIDILHHIRLSHISLGNNIEAQKWENKMRELDHADGIKKIIQFRRYNEADKSTLQINGEADKIEKKKFNITLEKIKADYENLYHSLCRGEFHVPPEISKQLKCRYYNKNVFLKLAPIKMEYKYQNPDIVVFYDVMSDDEIEAIMKIAQPRLKHALAYSAEAKGFTIGDNRISKSAWLGDSESALVETVSRRVADFTGLNMDTADLLQVVNYGIGGHYIPHYDYALPNAQQFPESIGNRIATVLFYMSDVAQGGATVFMKLNLSLFPVRGAAAVWFNLLETGEGDRDTVHAACPVLRGSKWVSNKWIHVVGQEFQKPCGLEYQSDGMTRMKFDN